MRTFLVACLALLGCGGGSSGTGASGEPQGMVKIDGAGSVTVKDQNNSNLPDSPFTCGGGNCGDTSVVSTTHSITFTPTPATGFKFTSATIELGSGNPTPVTAGTVISVDPAAGWALEVVFDPI
jgi:hypothetical protein